MQSTRNDIIIACAGARKTSSIVEQALGSADQKVLITTYTNENVEQIKDYIIQTSGSLPANITVLSWYSFLLQECVRPYQSLVTDRERIRSILFGEVPQPHKFARKNNLDQYFLTKNNDILQDRVSDFVCLTNKKTGGLVVSRLEKIYDLVFIDEAQDMQGYDFDFIDHLAKSSIAVVVVGDPRQKTYRTNRGRRVKDLASWVEEHKKKAVFAVVERNECYRCNQEICDFADKLYPEYCSTISRNTELTGHDGVFNIFEEEVLEYVKKYNPQILRYDKRADTMGLPSINIGTSKGRTYPRVLIFPTEKMKDYIRTGDLSKAGHISKFYVAVTRAKFSVAFVLGKK